MSGNSQLEANRQFRWRDDEMFVRPSWSWSNAAVTVVVNSQSKLKVALFPVRDPLRRKTPFYVEIKGNSLFLFLPWVKPSRHCYLSGSGTLGNEVLNSPQMRTWVGFWHQTATFRASCCHFLFTLQRRELQSSHFPSVFLSKRFSCC